MNGDAKELLALLMRGLDKASQPSYQDITIVRQGDKIIMPEGMTHEDAIKWHQRMMEEEESVINVHETIEAYPLDGALALTKALKNRFGWTSLVPTSSFWGSQPPSMIGLEIDIDQSIQVPWGRIQIPGMQGWLHASVAVRDGRIMFGLHAQTQMRFKDLVHSIVNDVKQILAKDSIYRAKAIRVEFPNVEEGDDFDPQQNMPKFIDVRQISVDELIFSHDIEKVLATTLWTPIQKTDLCRKAQIPLKRGILLEGPFGTGKTLAANVTARIAVENGWTFIYLANIAQLAQAMHFAGMYQPAVIFAEDIDRADDYNQRGPAMNEILNTIDGIGYKHAEIMTVLTTNHVERITQAMLRPGRLDAVIGVRAPDAEAVERLIRLYARGMLRGGTNIAEIAEKLQGQIPATIREVVERSKLAAIARGDLKHITAADLDVATTGMVHHLELLKEKQPDERSDIEKAATILVGTPLFGNHQVKTM